MTPHGRDSLPIREAAVPYLLNMYSLEMGAGWSFHRARQFLAEQGFLYKRLEVKLRTAYKQEIEHAGLIHRILTHVQVPFLLNKAKLNRHARAFEKKFTEGWETRHLPYVGILFNQTLEQHVVDTGLQTFVNNMYVLAGLLRSERIEALADVYETQVFTHEPEHVALDVETLEALNKCYPASVREAMNEGMNVSIFTTALSGFVRTRHNLERLMKDRHDYHRYAKT